MKKYLLLLFSWSLLLAACQGANNRTVSGDPQMPSFPPVPTLDPDAVVLGQQVYTRHCAECHGAKLEGDADWQNQNEDRSFRAPPHDASGHTWHHSDNVLIAAIQLGGARLPANIGGTSNMPAYVESLTDEEILAVLAYIKSSWPDNIRQIQWEATVQDQANVSE